MNRTALLRGALWALLRNKMRSVLTVLGVTIGIAAVICVVAIGKAGQAQVEQQLNNLGDNFVWIEAGGRAVNGVRTGTHGTKTLSQDDVERAADVCVIGRTVRDQLFGALDPIGKVIRVRDMPCKVVATLRPKGLAISGQDQDDTIILPYTTAMKKLKGNNWLDDVLCSAVSAEVVKLAGQQAGALLRDRHPLRPEEDDDFNIRNPEDIIQAQLDASRTLSALLIAVASVSLLVGGIGIMNVMLVSVTERTREIGVRVAVGATEQAIRLQFLGESVLLSLVGGAAGVVAGVAGSLVVGRTLGWPMQMSPEAVLVAALFSIAVGVFFGYYPARKASLLDPIEALRYE